MGEVVASKGLGPQDEQRCEGWVSAHDGQPTQRVADNGVFSAPTGI